MRWNSFTASVNCSLGLAETSSWNCRRHDGIPLLRRAAAEESIAAMGTATPASYELDGETGIPDPSNAAPYRNRARGGLNADEGHRCPS